MRLLASETSHSLKAAFIDRAAASAHIQEGTNERFAQLQADLADTENKIAYARNYYNGAVEAYNIKAQSFPGVLIAGATGFTPAEFFTAEAGASALPTANASI